MRVIARLARKPGTGPGFRATSVAYESLHGDVDGPGSKIASWTCAPSQPSLLVPQRALPILFNLWLLQGKPPSDGKPVEIVIKSFKFRTP
ncbi:MAG: hypothetical protein AB7P03_01365 [Kofleriaceae bacterium]